MSGFVWLAVLFSVAILSYLLIQLFLKAIQGYRLYFTQHTQLHLSDVFLFLDPRQLWQITLMFAIVVGLVLYALFGSIFLSAMLGLCGLWLPKWALKQLRLYRWRRFDRQLPDALCLLAESLRAGSSIQSALTYTLDEATAPLSQEFGLMLREQRLGLGLDQVLLNLEQRISTEACALFSSALRIANETGGNVADVLENIAHVLRQRQHIELRIISLTSQGVLQMWVVGLLPFALMLIFYQLEEQAMRQLWETSLGWFVLGIIFLLEGFGIWWIRKIIRIDV